MRMCVGDLEGDGLLPEVTRMWCGVFKDVRTNEVFRFGPTDIPDMLKFMDTIDVLAMHNGVGYDWPALEKLYGYQYPGKKVDTLLMSRLQDPYRQAPYGCKKGPHSVEAYGIRFHRHKPEHEDWSQFSADMMHRCEEDVHIQHMILDYLIDEAKPYSNAWKDAHPLTRDLFEILTLQEEYGWKLDLPRTRRYISLLGHYIDRIDRLVSPHLPFKCIPPKKSAGKYLYYKEPFTKAGKLQHYIVTFREETGWSHPVGGPFSKVEFRQVSLDSNDETKEYLLNAGWKPKEWNYNKQTKERTSPKLGQNDDFEGVNGTVGKLIAKRVVYRHRRSQMQGWLDKVRPDGRISQGISGIADTCRLKHTRVVNVPGSDKLFGAPMRKVFIAKPGYKIVGVDAAGCQNRMLAARVGDPAFTETLINGVKEDKTSIHYVNQAAIRKIAGFEPTYKICKNLNYAFIFGARDPKLSQTAGMPSSYGPKIREALLSVAPGFEELVNGLTKEWRANKAKYGRGWVTGLDGRPIFIPSEHAVLVYVLQSDEAILMQTALVLLYGWLKEKGWVHGREYGFVANIHDEYQAEVREDLAQEYAELAAHAIVAAGEQLNIACPQAGEYDIGDNWNETH